jgi:hypothetical protein
MKRKARVKKLMSLLSNPLSQGRGGSKPVTVDDTIKRLNLFDNYDFL